MKAPALADLEAQFNDPKLPPVADWSPELSGEMDLVILRNGTWMHEGAPIRRPKLVRLFASILRREGDDYFLLTPVEKWRIGVELAPLLIDSLARQQTAEGEAIVFTTNTQEHVILNEDHLLWVEQREGKDEPVPLVHIRSGLNALINRNVFYELVELAREENGELLVSSLGQDFSLGSL